MTDQNEPDERPPWAGGSSEQFPGAPLLVINGSFAAYRRFLWRPRTLVGVIVLILMGFAAVGVIGGNPVVALCLFYGFIVLACLIAFLVASRYIRRARVEVTPELVRYRKSKTWYELHRAGGLEAWLQLDPLGRAVGQLFLRETARRDAFFGVFTAYFDIADLDRLLRVIEPEPLSREEWIERRKA